MCMLKSVDMAGSSSQSSDATARAMCRSWASIGNDRMEKIADG
jgi:hypothetical protein